MIMLDKTAFYSRVGDLIQSARLEARLNQGDLASNIGLTRSSLSQIEKGTQSVSLYHLTRIAQELCQDVCKLIPGPMLDDREFDQLTKSRISDLDQQNILNLLDEVNAQRVIDDGNK